MTINTAEIRFCSECYGCLYVAITSPPKWVHVSTDTTTCGSEAKA
jgi:hypothetical protein